MPVLDKLSIKKVLLIVDMQNDFMPGGSLSVAHADALIPIINQLMPYFSLIVTSQDWHPRDHVSFFDNHLGKKIGDTITVNNQPQLLWPIHCVRNTKGAEIVSSLKKQTIAKYFYKGTDKDIDGYSAFFDNAHWKSTGLGEYLKEQNIQAVYIAGVATEYCVLYSALDALDGGFTVFVITDACRAINLHPYDEQKALTTMAKKGAKIISTLEIFA